MGVPVDVGDERDEDVEIAEAELARQRRPTADARRRWNARHRRLDEHQASERVDAREGSWWTRPDANFARESERLRTQGKQPRIESANKPIGWEGAV